PRARLPPREGASPAGGSPPIVTVKLGETYFVIDGHHRAALARRVGAATIDADVTELIAPVPLAAGAHTLRGRPAGARADLPRGQRACGGAPLPTRRGQPPGALPRAAREHPGARLPHD